MGAISQKPEHPAITTTLLERGIPKQNSSELLVTTHKTTTIIFEPRQPRPRYRHQNKDDAIIQDIATQ